MGEEAGLMGQGKAHMNGPYNPLGVRYDNDRFSISFPHELGVRLESRTSRFPLSQVQEATLNFCPSSRGLCTQIIRNKTRVSRPWYWTLRRK